MSDKRRPIPRTKMSAEERRSRSRLAQVISQGGLLRGSLLVRRRVCGKPNCRCTLGREHEHESLYLVISQGGRTHQLYVPRTWEALVREWVENYQHAKELLEAVSQIHWDKVRQRRD